MAKAVTEVTRRDVQTLNSIKDRLRPYCSGKMMPIGEQEELVKEVEDFFAEEIAAAMNYTDKLPTYYDCGGTAERKELLKQEAFLIILEQMNSETEEMHEFNDYIQGFREAIFKKLYACTQQAQKESIRVDVKKDKKTNENEQCTVLSGGKDITAAACNPNYENVQEESADADAVMNCNMGQFQSF